MLFSANPKQQNIIFFLCIALSNYQIHKCYNAGVLCWESVNLVVRRSEVAELAEIERAIAKYGARIKFYDHFNLPQHPNQIKRENLTQETLEKLDGLASMQEELVPPDFD